MLSKYQICYFRMILILLLVTTIGGCRKLVDIQAPVTGVNQDNVYASDATAISVLTGIYIAMSRNDIFTGNGGTSGSISLSAGLSADEFTLWNGIPTNDVRYYLFTNALFANVPGINPGSNFWSQLYNQSYIFACNSAIEGLTKSSVLTPAIKQQLLGEAKFLRAFFYFYLVNLYGDVPLITATDWQVNVNLSRTAKVQVYQHIISDLLDAQNLLSQSYLNGNLQPYSGLPERIRPSKAAATAFLARVYLYAGDYLNAEIQATSVINNSEQFSLTTLNNVFLKNSTETIWQLQPTTTGHNTEDGWVFILNTALSSSKPVCLSTFLLDAFEIGDNRRANWVKDTSILGVNYSYPYKYKSATNNAAITEYLMVLRLSEQYLIRAEARVQQNKIGIAQDDLNMIRARANLGITMANDKTSLLTSILHERQVELFTEWGHRWFDLKRTGNVDGVMNVVTPLKGGLWHSYQQLYPIPLADIQKDPNLNQSQGY